MIQMLFVMFVFAFLGIAGLTVDLGMARLTHLQMRNGAEASAMEGLRMAHHAPTEIDRRTIARNTMLWVYDDNFDPASGDPFQHGAGPLYELSGGTPGAHALQKISVSDTRVYLPDLQLNLANAVHGDMVSGHYLIEDLEHHEESNYARTDFVGVVTPLSLLEQLIAIVRALEVPPGIRNSLLQRLEKALEDFLAGGAALENLNDVIAGISSFIEETEAQHGKHLDEDTADEMIAIAEAILALLDPEEEIGLPAFLVRLRRTRDPTDTSTVAPLDDVEGVSSSGPALSFLLGRGGLIDNQARREGVKVRATAIAAAREATSVGRATTVPGATPFVLEYSFWNSLGPESVVLRSGINGRLHQGEDEDEDEDVIGFTVPRRAWSIGNTVSPVPTSLNGVGVTEIYVPVYANLDTRRIVGFGTVETIPHANGVRIRRRPRIIAPTNASAAVALGLAGLPDFLLRAVVDRNRALRSPLLAPVLVR